MIKVGFNVLAWSADISEDLFPIIDRLKNIGYDGVEFFVGSDKLRAYAPLGQHAKELGLEVTTVTVVSPDADPVSDSAEVRQKGLDRIKWSIDRSQELGSKVLCGPFHSAHAHFYGRPGTKEELKRAAETLYAAGEYAQQAGVVLTPEALNRFECYLLNTMEQLSALLSEINHPNVKGMFDTHHANIEEKSYQEALKTIGSQLHHVHISENDRGTPGGGHIPFDAAFEGLKAIDYSGWLTIEAFSRNDPAFANAINVWRQYDDPWDIAERGYEFIKNRCQKFNLS